MLDGSDETGRTLCPAATTTTSADMRHQDRLSTLLVLVLMVLVLVLLLPLLLLSLLVLVLVLVLVLLRLVLLASTCRPPVSQLKFGRAPVSEDAQYES